MTQNRWDRAGILTTVLASAFALAIGIVVGFVTTFTHRELTPWGLVAGVLVVGALVAGFRLVFDSRIIAAAAGLGAIGATGLLMFPGAGRSAFVIDDAIGYVWAILPTVLVAAIVIWPRPHRQDAALARPKMDT